jgi:peroxiredoxin Q/BCP
MKGRSMGLSTVVLALLGVLIVAGLWLGIGRSQAADLLQVGSPAPAFSLPNQDGQQISNEALGGDWFVLYFYPKDDTPGCTKEACSFRDQLGDLKKLGVRVLGVSFDTVASHRAFADKHALPFDLLADPKGEVIRRYHAKSIMPGFARRVSYLVDGGGVIRKVYPDVSPSLHAGEIIADVQRLRGL